jgi:3D (Asp-Asp-Asp) domain-containing protein
MQRHALSVLILALALALPARASHHHHHAKAAVKPVLPVVAASKPADQPMASSKGARLVANSILPGGKVAPKKVAAKPAGKPVPVVAAVNPAPAPAANPLPPGHLARLTAYWTEEDPWTAKHESSTGIRLHEGHCAVDPKLIPYGSVVQIPGMGTYVAVDTGSAVISRQAALGSGQTKAERDALVVDLFFENRKEAEDFAAHGPSYVSVNWTPRSLAYARAGTDLNALPAIPTIPAGTVYVLAQAPSLADTRMPLAFRSPQL